jgi:aminocarboxymuconate-semialdehyde decarboxylase
VNDRGERTDAGGAVDVHVHVIVPEILRSAAPGEAWRPEVSRDARGQIVTFGGRAIRAAIGEFTDVERILEESAARGIGRVVLSPWVPLLRYDADPSDALRSSRVQNEAISSIAARNPGRVWGLGTVPLQDPEVAAAELETVMRLPGVGGVEVVAAVGTRFIGDDELAPFWAAAASTGAVVMVHPTTTGLSLPVFNRGYLWNTVANPIETAIAAAELAVAGILERHPDLKILLSHAGGALPALGGRLRHADTFQPQARERLREPIEASLRRFYFDTIAHDPRLLRMLIDWVGAGHVALGSDHPFDMGDPDPVGSVRALGLSADDEQRIVHGTAEALFEGVA